MSLFLFERHFIDNVLAECDQGLEINMERDQDRSINGGRNEKEEVKFTDLTLSSPCKMVYHSIVVFKGGLSHLSQR